MRRWPSAGLGALLALAAPAAAQTGPGADTAPVASALAEIVSIVSYGMVSVQAQSVESVPDGGAYRLTFPLNGLQAPVGAAMTATARPSGDGFWDIGPVRFPASGASATGPGGHRAFTIGNQDITARIDPGFERPATYDLTLTDVHQDIDLPGGKSEQSIARYKVDGTLSAGPSGLVNLVYGAKASDARFATRVGKGVSVAFSVREAGMHLSVADLDRAKSERLRLAIRAMGSRPRPADAPGAAPSPGMAAPPKAVQRELVESAAGLLTKLEGLETIEGMHIAVTPGSTVDVGRVLMAVAADTANGRLDTTMDVAMDGLAIPSIPADFEPFVPRRMTMRPLLTGVPSGRLLELLREATAEDSDGAALGKQLDALLADPGVSAGIDAIGFDSGPLQVTGTARVVPGPNKAFTLQLHLAATGMEALLERVRAQPALQKVLPMLFLAKGMSRQEGGALVWDIELGDGAAKVNGVPVGQPPAARR